MVFSQRIKEALTLRVGVYDTNGNLIEGDNVGFLGREGYFNGKTCIGIDDLLVVVSEILSQDAVKLIKSMKISEESINYSLLKLIYENNCLDEEALKRYKNNTAFYIQCNSDLEDILKSIYYGESFETLKEGSGIFLVKEMEDPLIEAQSLVEGILLEKGDVIIGCGRSAYDDYTIRDSMLQSKEAVNLAMSIGFNKGIFPIDKIGILGMLKECPKDKVKFYLNGGLNGLFEVIGDRVLTKTAEELLKYDLNISETSRRLYLHRNTLLYRLEKIKNLTGLDIKRFEDAYIFKVVMLLYKLNKF